MSPKRIIFLISIVLIISILAVWLYPKVEDFYKVDHCLDSGGSWNYELSKCEYGLADSNKTKSTESFKRPSRSEILNSEIDTSLLFKVWVEHPNSPHADFYIDKNEFYVVDYDGNGAFPYLLNENKLTIYYDDAVRVGTIVDLDLKNLTIEWSDGLFINYSEWEN